MFTEIICKFSCILTTENNQTHGSQTAPSVEVFPACLGTAQCWVFPWEPSHFFVVCHYSGANTFEKTLCMESPYIRAHACRKASHTSTVGHVSFKAPMLLEHAFGCWGQLINHASTIPLGKHFPQWNCSRFRRWTFLLPPPPLHSEDPVPSGRAPQLLLSRGLSIVPCRSNMDLLGPKEVTEIKSSCVFHRPYCCEVFTAERTIRHSSQKENTQIPTALLL